MGLLLLIYYINKKNVLMLLLFFHIQFQNIRITFFQCRRKNKNSSY